MAAWKASRFRLSGGLSVRGVPLSSSFAFHDRHHRGYPTIPDTPKWYSPAVTGYVKDKQQIEARLNRIEGQVRGLSKMVAEDRYCIDVLTQVSAVQSALESFALLLLRDHTEHCVAEAIRSGEGTDKVRELSEAVERLVRR